MAFDQDPYRTLGLARGASLDEVKRAYRRLAKEHHPDSGGERALPRFLEIQAAYEALAGDGATGVRPSASATPRRPWQPDTRRADATRRAYGSRSRRTESRPPRPPRTPRPERPPNKATPGSTTYDGADEHPFEPGWEGADWYGTTSGTYWTVNPREYADPRKHGPEYQARAQRARERAAAGQDPDEAPTAEPEVDPRLGRDAAWWSTDASASGHTEGTTAPPADSGRPAPPPPPPSAPPGPRASVPEGSADPVAAGAGFMRSIIHVSAPRPVVRLTLALGGGVPLAVAVTWLLGELTGCARFAATCPVPIEPISWALTAVLLGLLVVLPAAAAIASVGSLVALAVAVPATVFLSVTGGPRLPEASGAALGFVLSIAWMIGAAYALSIRWRARGDPPPVS
jgi:hypothetical protein